MQGGLGLDVVEVYDPGSDSWTTLAASLPAVEWQGTGVALSGEFYVVTVWNIYRYDPLGGTWTTLTAPAVGRAAFSAAALNGQVFMVGGVGPGTNASNRVDAYTP